MPRNPTVLIGLGGAGTTIVTRVRRRLLATLADNPTLSQTLVDRRFQFLGFDTWVDNSVPDDLYRLGKIRATGDAALNTIVQQKHNSDRDRFFAKWWPYGSYDYPGNITNGAGRVRIVGKAATYLDIIGSGMPTAGPKPFDQMVNDAIDDAYRFRTADGVPGFVSVFIVSGLAGGTGSGATLLLANYLKPRLPEGTTMIGAFVLPSIMALADTNHTEEIYANGFAALKELDWWMLPEAWRKAKTLPFIELPDGTKIAGEQPPFSWCYLFSRYNSQGLCLSSYDEYLDLVADCLRLQLYSTDFDLEGPGSNFNRDMLATGHYHGRSRSYASAFVASLEFPVEPITRHLALEYAQRLLNEWFLSPADSELLGKREAEVFCSGHRLDNAEAFGELRKEFFDQVEQFSEAPEPATRAALLAAGPRETRAVIARQMDAAEIWLTRRKQIAGVNESRLRAAICGEVNILVEHLLSRPEGDGFEVTYEALKQLRTMLDVILKSLQAELGGSLDKDIPGVRADLARLLQPPQQSTRRHNRRELVPVAGTLEWHIQGIEAEYKKFPVVRHIAAKKEKFHADWWEPWIQLRQEELLCEKGQQYLQALRHQVSSILLEGMRAMQDLLEGVKETCRFDAATALTDKQVAGTNSAQQQPWTLADRIYCKPKWLQEDFQNPEPLDPSISHLVVVDTDRGVLHHLHQYWDLLSGDAVREQDVARRKESAQRDLSDLLRTSCTRKFAPKVEALSLWDALVCEAGKRHDVTDPMQFIQTKLTSLVQRAGPFWRPDVTLLSDHQELTRRPAIDRVIALNQTALAAFADKMGPPGVALRDGLPGILGIQNDKTQDFDDHHQVYLFIRNGGLPLQALNVDERNAMEQHSEQHSKASNVPTYADRRYEAALPPGFAFFPDDEVYYNFVMAMHFHFIAYGSTRNIVRLHRPGMKPTLLFPGQGLSGAVANFGAFRADHALLKEVGTLISQAWQGVPRGRERDEVQAALILVADELAAAGGEKPRQEFWSRAGDVLKGRLDRQDFSVTSSS